MLGCDCPRAAPGPQGRLLTHTAAITVRDVWCLRPSKAEEGPRKHDHIIVGISIVGVTNHGPSTVERPDGESDLRDFRGKSLHRQLRLFETRLRESKYARSGGGAVYWELRPRRPSSDIYLAASIAKYRKRCLNLLVSRKTLLGSRTFNKELPGANPVALMFGLQVLHFAPCRPAIPKSRPTSSSSVDFGNASASSATAGYCRHQLRPGRSCASSPLRRRARPAGGR